MCKNDKLNSKKRYEQFISQQFDSQGTQIFPNSETNGRRHVSGFEPNDRKRRKRRSRIGNRVQQEN